LAKLELALYLGVRAFRNSDKQSISELKLAKSLVFLAHRKVAFFLLLLTLSKRVLGLTEELLRDYEMPSWSLTSQLAAFARMATTTLSLANDAPRNIVLAGGESFSTLQAYPLTILLLASKYTECEKFFIGHLREQLQWKGEQLLGNRSQVRRRASAISHRVEVDRLLKGKRGTLCRIKEDCYTQLVTKRRSTGSNRL